MTRRILGRNAIIVPSSLALAVCLLMPSVSLGASKVCTNGQCVSCEGGISCVNNACTCNGVSVDGKKEAAAPEGPCGREATVVHGNGGGKVSTTASVAASVFVSSDSAVCGRAQVSGPTRLLAGSVVNGTARVSGRSTLTGSVVNGTTQVTKSELTNSTLNGGATVSNSVIANSVLNGNAPVVGQRLQNSVINN
jgi:hypothetical protein